MHEMDFLEGFEDLDLYFTLRDDCLEIIRCFARDLAIMTNAMYCPKDLGMGNVMVNTIEGKMAWLDTDLKKMRTRKKLSRQLIRQLDSRFFRHLMTPHQGNLFWEVFCGRSTIFSTKNDVLSGYDGQFVF